MPKWTTLPPQLRSKAKRIADARPDVIANKAVFLGFKLRIEAVVETASAFVGGTCGDVTVPQARATTATGWLGVRVPVPL